jgi:type VI secretion system protein ImpM
VTENFGSAAHNAPLVAGWYGKMPCLGDFATRRLSPDFIRPWDAWLQRSIAASRQQLGDAWLSTYLTSPMWRFALAAGACGEEASIGVLVPSVDRVGRYFPLTLALVLSTRSTLVHALREQSWFAELEAIGLAALNTDFSIDALERSLAEHPFHGATGDAASFTEELTSLPSEGASPRMFHFSSAQAIPAAIELAAHRVLEQASLGLWWCVEPETGASELHVSTGLPPPEHFRALLERHGRAAAGTALPEPTLSLDPLKALDSSGSR